MSGEIEIPETPNWLQELEAKRERRVKARLGHEAGAGAPCLKCGNKCPGLDLHFWRKCCKNCKCPKEEHEVPDDDIYGWAQFQLLGSKPLKSKILLPGKKDELDLDWVPKGRTDIVQKYLNTLPPDQLPIKGSQAAKDRKQLLQKQIPIHDIDPTLCHELTEDESQKMNEYIAHVKQSSVGMGQIVSLSNIIKGKLHLLNPTEAALISKRYAKDIPVNEIVKHPSTSKSGSLYKNLEALSLKNLPEYKPNSINPIEDNTSFISTKIKDKDYPLYCNDDNRATPSAQFSKNINSENSAFVPYQKVQEIRKNPSTLPNYTPGKFTTYNNVQDPANLPKNVKDLAFSTYEFQYGKYRQPGVFPEDNSTGFTPIKPTDPIRAAHYPSGRPEIEVGVQNRLEADFDTLRTNIQYGTYADQNLSKHQVSGEFKGGEKSNESFVREILCPGEGESQELPPGNQRFQGGGFNSSLDDSYRKGQEEVSGKPFGHPNYYPEGGQLGYPRGYKSENQKGLEEVGDKHSGYPLGGKLGYPAGYNPASLRKQELGSRNSQNYPSKEALGGQLGYSSGYNPGTQKGQEEVSGIPLGQSNSPLGGQLSYSPSYKPGNQRGQEEVGGHPHSPLGGQYGYPSGYNPDRGQEVPTGKPFGHQEDASSGPISYPSGYKPGNQRGQEEVGGHPHSPIGGQYGYPSGYNPDRGQEVPTGKPFGHQEDASSGQISYPSGYKPGNQRGQEELGGHPHSPLGGQYGYPSGYNPDRGQEVPTGKPFGHQEDASSGPISYPSGYNRENQRRQEVAGGNSLGHKNYPPDDPVGYSPGVTNPNYPLGGYSPNKTLEKSNKKLSKLHPNFVDVNEDFVNPTEVNIGLIKDINYPDIKSATHETSDFYEEYSPDSLKEILNNIILPDCHYCKKPFEENEFAMTIDRANILFHADCFKCAGCNQILADNVYFYHKESDNVYCLRDYAKIRGFPRCKACDELIFTKEYCLAENSTFHLKHFCCTECDGPLAGKDYTIEDEMPYCLPCFEQNKASKCNSCGKVIKTDEVGCTLNGIHFHADDFCYSCKVCKVPLMGKKLLLRNERLFCSRECFAMEK